MSLCVNLDTQSIDQESYYDKNINVYFECFVCLFFMCGLIRISNQLL